MRAIHTRCAPLARLGATLMGACLQHARGVGELRGQRRSIDSNAGLAFVQSR